MAWTHVVALCRMLAAVVCVAALCAPANASREDSAIDAIVRATMHADDVPGLSLAIVRNGRLSYRRAFGIAYPGHAASPETRFAIGSVSKEFTAAAILLLAERGKLSLDDPVSRFLPELASSSRVTIRELLGQTSGYSDYFLQEYIPKRTQEPTTVDHILATWAHKPLDFVPGTQWQYSSTNYLIAGRIVEIASGRSFEAFLTSDILRPAGITDAGFVDEPPSQRPGDARGFYRFALGPPRPAPVAGRNWLFAMADLEMTASDVARWDVALMSGRVLSRASFDAMRAEGHTSDGAATGYGLGFFVRSFEDASGTRRVLLHHPGEISGFRAHNYLVPDTGFAIVVLTNAEYSDAEGEIVRGLQAMFGMGSSQVAKPAAADDAARQPARVENAVEMRARVLLGELATGTIDRRELAPDASATFTPQALADIERSLAPLGRLRRVTLESTQSRGGTKHYAIALAYERRALQIAEYDLPNGTIEQFMIDEAPR